MLQDTGSVRTLRTQGWAYRSQFLPHCVPGSNFSAQALLVPIKSRSPWQTFDPFFVKNGMAVWHAASQRDQKSGGSLHDSGALAMS